MVNPDVNLSRYTLEKDWQAFTEDMATVQTYWEGSCTEGRHNKWWGIGCFTNHSGNTVIRTIYGRINSAVQISTLDSTSQVASIIAVKRNLSKTRSYSYAGQYRVKRGELVAVSRVQEERIKLNSPPVKSGLLASVLQARHNQNSL